MSAAAGAALARERSARGLSIEQVAAATRVRPRHLVALESGDLTLLPGPVYARGYLRTYAAFLGLEAGPLLEFMEPPLLPNGGSISIRRLTPQLPAHLALTTPLLAGAGLACLALLFGLYAWRQFETARPTPVPAATPVVAVPLATQPAPDAVGPVPLVSEPPPGRVKLVLITVTEQTWVSVLVDGQPVLGANGRFLEPGQPALFAGRVVRVSSGKGAATMVTVDGRELGALGSGVTSGEFKG